MLYNSKDTESTGKKCTVFGLRQDTQAERKTENCHAA